MNEIKCYILEAGPSQRNLPLYFGYLFVPPIYALATIFNLVDKNIDIKEACLHGAIILVSEWLIRTFIIKQRPGYVCIKNEILPLWYMAGIVKIIYPCSRFKLLKSDKEEWIKFKINKRLLPLSIKFEKYQQTYKYPNIFTLFEVKMKSN